jgi:hypothetical protein
LNHIFPYLSFSFFSESIRLHISLPFSFQNVNPRDENLVHGSYKSHQNKIPNRNPFSISNCARVAFLFSDFAIVENLLKYCEKPDPYYLWLIPLKGQIFEAKKLFEDLIFESFPELVILLVKAYCSFLTSDYTDCLQIYAKISANYFFLSEI